MRFPCCDHSPSLGLRHIWPRASHLVLFAFLCSMVGCSHGGERPTRIVLITLDTLRWDSFAGEGEESGLMPAVRHFAERALVFRRYYSATSSTQPTHATLFTGLYPWQHGVPRNGAVLSSELHTVAERMKQAGYHTNAVVSSFPLHRTFGFNQGFDGYDDNFEQGGAREWSGQAVPVNFSSNADTVTRKALRLLDRMDDTSQFLWFHYFDPHSPYGDSIGEPLARGPELRRDLKDGGKNIAVLLRRARSGYASDVRFLDSQLAVLLERLDDDSSKFETHIVLLSDHGESFGEAGSVGHGKRLTEEQIHVPLMIRSPRLAAGVSHVATGSVDVAATLFALAGSPESAPHGRDLTQPLSDEGPVIGMRRTFETPYLELRTDGSRHMIDVDDAWFYAVEGERVFKGNGLRILANDSAPVPSAIAGSLRDLFRSLKESLANQNVQEELDPETRRKLEALGYVR